MVFEMHLDHVALANPDEFAGHLAAEGPEGVADAVRQASLDLRDLQMHDHFGCMVAAYGGWHRRRVSQDGVFGADNFRMCILITARAPGGYSQEHGCCSNKGALRYGFHLLASIHRVVQSTNKPRLGLNIQD